VTALGLFHEALEADLAVMGVDLLDLYRDGPGLTARKVLALTRALGPDSALATAEREHKSVAKDAHDEAKAREFFKRREANP